MSYTCSKPKGSSSGRQMNKYTVMVWNVLRASCKMPHTMTIYWTVILKMNPQVWDT